MSVATFTRHLTLTLAFVAVAWASPRQADAAMITQTRNFTLMGPALQTLNWDQFDSSLGTLTGIEYSVNGVLSGSFTVTNLDSTNSLQVYDSTNRFQTAFQGAGAPGAFPGISVSPINSVPTSGAFPGTTVSPSSSQLFNIVTDPAQNMVVPTTDFFSFASYFTGPGTVDQFLGQNPAATVSGVEFNFSAANVTTTGTATLVYIYDIDDPTVIPEPFTAAFTGLLIGGGAIVGARRKRRLAKTDKKS
jgi:hypothetical protein